jgi:predicted amidohydrolase YtcJ
VRGNGYNEFYLAEERHPDRYDLDAAAPEHAVKLTHRSGHAHILNSLALIEAGIGAETGDPPGGIIDRDLASGEPTGILYGMGGYLAGRIPPVCDAEIEAGLVRANGKLLSWGITSVQDASYANDFARRELAESWKAQGLFQPRLTMMMGYRAFETTIRKSGAVGEDNADLRFWGVKIMIGQVTGELQPCQDELNEAVSAVNSAGLQAIIHAVEEPEIEAACAAVEFALHRHPRQDHRHRIEHCSVCTPGLQRRIADLGMMSVTQPSFIYFNGDRYLKTVPAKQLPHLYGVGSMQRNGIRIGFSSDCPIAEANPLVGICAAATRMTETGERLFPEEGIPVADALRMYTRGSAEAAFEEGIKGSIAPGKLADLVVLSEDPRAIDPCGIKDIRVVMTVLGGRIVWSDGTILH